jgi:hypothetical protein
MPSEAAFAIEIISSANGPTAGNPRIVDLMSLPRCAFPARPSGWSWRASKSLANPSRLHSAQRLTWSGATSCRFCGAAICKKVRRDRPGSTHQGLGRGRHFARSMDNLGALVQSH